MNHFLNLLISFMLIASFLGGAVKSQPKKVDVFWGLLGSYPREKQWNPYKLTRDDKTIDAASILFSIRRDYKTVEQISRETDISVEGIEHKLVQLKNCELVKENENKFIVNFPFWDIPLKDEINGLGLELADKVVDVLKAKLPDLKASFEKSTLPGQGYTWDDVALTIIGGFLLDTGLNDRGLRKWKVFDQKRDTPARPGNYRYWYKAVFDGWGKYWKFGHDQQTNSNSDIWFGLFYGQIPRERKMNWSKTWDVHDEKTRQIIFPLIQKGKIKKTKLQSKTEMSADSFNAVLQRMEQAEIIRIDGSLVHPNFPIFQEKDIQELFSSIDSICNQIIDEIYVPFLPKIQQTWQEVKPRNWEIQNIERFFVREVYDRPYNLTLDRLIREGVLPPSPVEPPFNYWGINGHFKLL